MKTIKPIRPNSGVEALYRKKLKLLIAEMIASSTYWIKAAYDPLIVFDATPIGNIKKVLKDLRKRWERKFEELAPKLAELYAKGIMGTSDYALRSALSEAGLSVKFTLTPIVRQNLEAIIAENVSLITNIPQQFMQQLEGDVMRNYVKGRDLGGMVDSIKRIGTVTQRRAELIANDQSNKANATMIRTRQMELGITEGIWNHSHAGKEPRMSHVAANGKLFNLAEGMLIDGKHILPGEEINCRCTWRGVLPK